MVGNLVSWSSSPMCLSIPAGIIEGRRPSRILGTTGHPDLLGSCCIHVDMCINIIKKILGFTIQIYYVNFRQFYINSRKKSK